MLFAGEFKTEKHNTHKLSRQKVALARLFTDFGYDVLLSDVDIVWMRDPQPYFAKYTLSIFQHLNPISPCNFLYSSGVDVMLVHRGALNLLAAGKFVGPSFHPQSC